jgi:hypothetical protein
VDRSEGAEETRDLASYHHRLMLRHLLFCVRTSSFAPSELRAFTTDTQGSAKPPPWAILRRSFAAKTLAVESPTVSWAKSFYAFGVLPPPTSALATVLLLTHRRLSAQSRLTLSVISAISLFKSVLASSLKPSNQQQQREPEHHRADKKRHHSKPHYAAQTDAGDSEHR